MKLAPEHPHYQHPRAASADAWTPVLVGVVNNARDFEIARDQHWYRIPLKHAPRQIAAEYLALYQTSVFGAQGQRIEYFAPILRYHLTTRAELLPDQSDHPRASEQYFKLEIGPLQRLQRPIPNNTQPRLTFIYTTLERLWNAVEIGDLWLREAARHKLYAAIREQGLAVECWYPVAMGDRPEADLALFGPNGRLTLYIDEPPWDAFDEPGPTYSTTPAIPADSNVLHANALDLLADPTILQETVRRLSEAVRPLPTPA